MIVPPTHRRVDLMGITMTHRLARLQGLPLTITKKLANERLFYFGPIQPNDGVSNWMESTYALFLSCPWRIQDERTIIVASADLFEPPPGVGMLDFEKQAKPKLTRQDVLLRRLFPREDQEPSLLYDTDCANLVAEVLLSPIGDLTVFFTNGLIMNIFADISEGSFWSIVPPNSVSIRSLVVNANVAPDVRGWVDVGDLS
jgi:hypothetical protein